MVPLFCRLVLASHHHSAHACYRIIPKRVRITTALIYRPPKEHRSVRSHQANCCASSIAVLVDLEVLIQHDGFVAAYSHLAMVAPTLGKSMVTAGEIVGVVGHTGVSFGAHLFFAVLQAGRAVDPAPLLGAPLCSGGGSSADTCRDSGRWREAPADAPLLSLERLSDQSPLAGARCGELVGSYFIWRNVLRVK